MAAGTLSRVRRRGHALGARRDREGQAGNPRDRTRGRGGAQKLARDGRRAPRRRRRGWVESHSAPLVGLGGRGELGGDRRDEAFAAWRRFLEGLAEQRPLVLVFEDLHWADDGLLDFVDELVDWVTDVPLLVVATARPELLERRPGWGGGKLNATTLALSPLTDEQTARASRARARAPAAPGRDPAALLESAGGNPLYAEQFAELYVERGSADELPLPETLQGIIAARLDGLSPTRRASAPGRGGRRQGLLDGRARTRRRRGDRHVSTRSSARASSAASDARRSRARASTRSRTPSSATSPTGRSRAPNAPTKHRGVAEWIESLGRPEDHAEMLAFHWRSALELARASGAETDDLVERARFSLRDAGDRASGLDNHIAAASLYDDALGLWPESDPERPDLLFRRAVALHEAYDEALQQQALEDARDALLAVGDTEHASETESYLARVFWDRGDQALARDHLARAETLAGDSTSVAAARVLAFSARIREIAGEVEEAQPLAESAFAMATELGLDELRAMRSRRSAWQRTIWTSGRAPRTWNARSRSHLRRTPRSPRRRSTTSPSTRRSPPSSHARAELYDEAMRLADRYGDASSVRFIRGNQIWIDLMLGRWDVALDAANSFIAECEAGSPHMMEPLCARSVPRSS